MRAVPQQAIDFIKAHEGLRLTAYRDSGGVWTIGYGSTGPDVIGGLSITQEAADERLNTDLETAATRLMLKVKPDIIAELTDNQYAALLSFVFNLGTPGTTIWKDLNAGNFDQVPADMMAFVYARVDGSMVKISGLVNRRADEVKLWSTEEPGSVVAAPSSAVTRNYATPAAPVDPKPRGGIGPAIASAVASLSLAASQAQGAVKSVLDALSPYAQDSHRVQAIISGLTMVAAALAVTTLILIWLRNRSVSRWEKTTTPSLPPGALPPPKTLP